MAYGMKHIARDGKRAGQWVTCTAEATSCPIMGSIHVEEDKLKEVQVWAGRRAFADITLNDYTDYLASQIAGTLDEDKRPMETLEEKRARLGEKRATTDPAVKRKQPGTKLREAEEEALNQKDHIVKAQFFSLVFKDYPAVLELTTVQQEKVYKYLNALYGPWGKTANYTKRAKTLEELIKNGNIDKVKVPENSFYKRATYVTVDRSKETEQERLDEPCKAKDPDNCPVHGKWGDVIAAIDTLKSGSNASATSQTVVKPAPQKAPVPVQKINGMIADYSPLNPDDATTKALLEKLRTYKGERKAFGRVPMKTKILEFMVHNQLAFTGTIGKPGFKKVSVKRYVSHLETELRYASDNLDQMQKIGQSKLKHVSNAMEKFVVSYERNENMEREIHDSFVEASKKELQTELFQKGYHDGKYLLKVSDATKASEIYALKKEISLLQKQDEFSLAGL